MDAKNATKEDTADDNRYLNIFRMQYNKVPRPPPPSLAPRTAIIGR